jgi:Integral membrane protein TerC family
LPPGKGTAFLAGWKHQQGGWESVMELFSPEFFSALAAIVVIDLVLAGDNAIVIALAARGVPKELRKKAIMWGTVVARRRSDAGVDRLQTARIGR